MGNAFWRTHGKKVRYKKVTPILEIREPPRKTKMLEKLDLLE